ncbi:MAG: hypothetical protein PF489_00550 [Salinivirgaceae bacterium]|jgi:putative transposase|nr:hypothetical protein [Salinivirgaceae bacterium]
MTNKYKNKYRVPSARMRNWDYKWNAPYFVTICAQNRLCYFGNVVNGKMQLSEIGEIVKQEWLKTFEMRPDMNLQMGEWQIMPNHFHAIIVIGENDYNRKTDGNTGTGRRRDAMHCVSTVQPAPPMQITPPVSSEPSKNQFGPQSKNLASVMRGFKSGVTTGARLIHADFTWQSRFHLAIAVSRSCYQGWTIVSAN